jgi:RHS repeat-associated protein
MWAEAGQNCDNTCYYRARYYNSLTGRFLSRDPEAGKPADPKTLHKYLYAGGDPVNRFDPRGRETVENGLLDFNSWKESLEVRAEAYKIKILICMEGLLSDWVTEGFIDPMISATAIEIYEAEARDVCSALI